MSIRAKYALHSDVRAVAQRIRDRNSIGTARGRFAVIDVIANGEEIVRPELMVEAAYQNVAVQCTLAVADVVARVRCCALTVWERKIIQDSTRDGINAIQRDSVAGKRKPNAAKSCLRVVNQDRITLTVAKVGEIAGPIRKCRDC